MEPELLTQERIGMDKISPSALNCYEECPRLFYYQNWLGLKIDEDKLHLDFGTAIHSTLEYLYSEYDDNFQGGWSVVQFEQLEEKWNELWKISSVPESTLKKYNQTKAGAKNGFKNREELFNYFREDGLEILKSYWNDKERLLVEYGYDLSDFEIPLKVELHNPENPAEKLPIPLSMRIDAVNRDKTKMVDFKTSGSKYDATEARKKIQGQCYLFGNLMANNHFISKFDYCVLRKGLKNGERVEVVELEYDMADMTALYFRIESILCKIANREFEIKKVGHSPYCNCKKYEEILSVKEVKLLTK